jgi:hypothetical protein
LNPNQEDTLALFTLGIRCAKGLKPFFGCKVTTCGYAGHLILEFSARGPSFKILTRGHSLTAIPSRSHQNGCREMMAHVTNPTPFGASCLFLTSCSPSRISKSAIDVFSGKLVGTNALNYVRRQTRGVDRLAVNHVLVHLADQIPGKQTFMSVHMPAILRTIMNSCQVTFPICGDLLQLVSLR